jgi:hypothetical protein
MKDVAYGRAVAAVAVAIATQRTSKGAIIGDNVVHTRKGQVGIAVKLHAVTGADGQSVRVKTATG